MATPEPAVLLLEMAPVVAVLDPVERLPTVELLLTLPMEPPVAAAPEIDLELAAAAAAAAALAAELPPRLLVVGAGCWGMGLPFSSQGCPFSLVQAKAVVDIIALVAKATSFWEVLAISCISVMGLNKRFGMFIRLYEGFA